MSHKKNIDLERIIQSAVAIADAGGFDAVTLAAVANHLGIRIPSLYNHVEGLQGLRYQLRLWGLQGLCEALRRSAVGKSGSDAIISIAYAYRSFAHQHPGIYSATQRAASPDEPELETAGREVLEILIAVLQPYQLDSDEMLHSIRALRSIMHGFVDLETLGGFAMALDRDESFQRLVQSFINGLKP